MNLRLLGAPTIKDVVPEMVDISSVSYHGSATPGDRLYDSNCTFLCGWQAKRSPWWSRRKHAACPLATGHI